MRWFWQKREPEGYWKLVAPYWDAVSIYDGAERFLSDFSVIPEASQHLLAAHWAQSEIRNGGFDQFFSNSTGVLGPEAVVGFRAIGMPMAADQMARALGCLGATYPRDREEREDALDQMAPQADDILTEAQSAFWDLLQSENGGFQAAADRFAARMEGSR